MFAEAPGLWEDARCSKPMLVVHHAVNLLARQANMSDWRQFDSLSLGERAGERVTTLRGGFARKVPHPNPLPQGEGACSTGHILLSK